MVLLNLIASLSLVASVGVPAVVSFHPVIEETSVSYLSRKNSIGFVVGGGVSFVYQSLNLFNDDDYYVMFDGILPKTEITYDDPSTYSEGFGVNVVVNESDFDVYLLVDDIFDQALLRVFIYDGVWHFADLNDEPYIFDGIYGLSFNGSGGLNLLESYRVLVSTDDVTLTGLPNYLDSKNIVPSITSGLGVVSNLASGLVGGFDSLALNNGALTNVMAFAFTLLGIGTAVGVAKLCFNWVTGRHGM